MFSGGLIIMILFEQYDHEWSFGPCGGFGRANDTHLITVSIEVVTEKRLYHDYHYLQITYLLLEFIKFIIKLWSLLVEEALQYPIIQ